MSRVHKLRRIVALSILVGAPFLTAAHRDSLRRHLALKRAEPAVNDTIAVSPKTIKLWFTEPVTAAGTAVRVVGPSDQSVRVGTASVDTAPLSPVVVAVSSPLKPGTYTVMWRAMSGDSHPVNGKFAFTIRSADQR